MYGGCGVSVCEQEAASERVVVGAVARHALAADFEHHIFRVVPAQLTEHVRQRQRGARCEHFDMRRPTCAWCSRPLDVFFAKNAHAAPRTCPGAMLPPASVMPGGRDVAVRVLGVCGRSLNAQVADTLCVARFEMHRYLRASEAALLRASVAEPVDCTLRVTGFDAGSKKVLCSEIFLSTKSTTGSVPPTALTVLPTIPKTEPRPQTCHPARECLDA